MRTSFHCSQDKDPSPYYNLLCPRLPFQSHLSPFPSGAHAVAWPYMSVPSCFGPLHMPVPLPRMVSPSPPPRCQLIWSPRTCIASAAAFPHLSDQAETAAACRESLTARGVWSSWEPRSTRVLTLPVTVPLLLRPPVRACAHTPPRPRCSLLILPHSHWALLLLHFHQFILVYCLGAHLPISCAQ